MNNHAAVGYQVVGAGVVNFADDVDLVVGSIGGDANDDGGLGGGADDGFCSAYLWLLPPFKCKVITIRVGRL